MKTTRRGFMKVIGTALGLFVTNKMPDHMITVEPEQDAVESQDWALYPLAHYEPSTFVYPRKMIHGAVSIGTMIYTLQDGTFVTGTTEWEGIPGALFGAVVNIWHDKQEVVIRTMYPERLVWPCG